MEKYKPPVLLDLLPPLFVAYRLNTTRIRPLRASIDGKIPAHSGGFIFFQLPKEFRAKKANKTKNFKRDGYTFADAASETGFTLAEDLR